MYLLSFYTYGLNVWDEGVLYNGARRMANGEMVFVDFYGYPPGRYWLANLSFKLFGKDMASVRLVLTFFTAFMPAMAFCIARRIVPTGYALLSASLMLMAPAVVYDRYFGFFALLNVLTILCAYEKNTFRQGLIWFAGLLLTFLFKFEIALISIFIFAALGLLTQRVKSWSAEGMVPGRKRVSWLRPLGMGALIFGAAFAALCLVSPTFWFSVKFSVHLLVTNYRNWSNPFPGLFSSHGGSPNFRTVFENALFYVPVFVYTWTFLSVGDEKELRRKRALGVTALFGTFTYGLIVWRAGFDNLIRVLPCCYVLSSYVLFRAMTCIRESIPPRFAMGASLARGLVVFPVIYFFLDMAVANGYYVGSVGVVAKEYSELSVPGTGVRADLYHKQLLEEFTAYLDANLKPGETIFALPLNPIWYYLTGKKNPTYYEWILPGMMRNEEMENRVIDDLKKADVRYVVYADIPIDNQESRRFPNYAPHIAEYVFSHYEPVKAYEGLFYILERVSSPIRENRPLQKNGGQSLSDISKP